MLRLARSRRAASPTTGAGTAADTSTNTSTDTLTGTSTGPVSHRPGPVGGLRGLRLLVRAGHPRLAVLSAAALTVAAALSGREPREVGLVLATALVGGLVLGWHNDLVDRQRDLRHHLPGKPVADGRLDPGTVWFALACGVLLLVPLAVTHGITAGSAYLVAVLVGVLGNVLLRQGFLSWVTWAASYALLPTFLSYGGWGGQALGDPPRVLVTVLAALGGIGVHVLTGLFGLVPEDADGWRSLPMRLGRRIGSSRLLAATVAYLGVVVTAIALVTLSGGL
ncbi:MAG: hypothetical protein LH468_06445 [Nocardioides sp.]|nr:hypothetical protein [Nocardioides sp.]